MPVMTRQFVARSPGCRPQGATGKKYLKDRWMLRLKDTATICSCWMGSNYLCDRSGYKRDTAQILREQSKDKD